MEPQQPQKLSGNEILKENSKHLRGTIQDSLVQDTTHFTKDETNLLKFHGTYQQDDRDKRQPLAKEGKEAAYSMMVRSKIPGGRLTADQYLAHDKLADQYGNKTLRITTRQGFQFHGVLKKNVKAVILAINKSLITTSGACGDIVRNVLACPAPHQDRQKMEIYKVTKAVSDQFLSRSGAYHEIWLNGEKMPHIPDPTGEEPIFGKTYLPRKFKIAIAFPDDNCIDVYSNDLGIVPEIQNGKLMGFNILVGGGFGMTHGLTYTYPRLATPLCFVKPEELLDISKAVVLVQRDFGNRADRRKARMKYLIDNKGLDWFRAEVEKRFGKKTEAPHPIHWKTIENHLGWHQELDGKWFLGLYIENGRIKDEGNFRLKTALKTLVQKYRPALYLTAQQDLLLSGFQESQKKEVEALFAAHGVKLPDQLSALRRDAMACPALPTCGLAIAESERVLPKIIDELEQKALKLGLDRQRIMVRMTGCPNGCARPYNAEIAFVGRMPGAYAILVGGSLTGDRLNFSVAEKVAEKDLPAAGEVLFSLYKQGRNGQEGFGDFCSRIGAETLKTALRDFQKP
jgi:sulfite reductase (ferredoxin)